jgi:hypothetical protein
MPTIRCRFSGGPWHDREETRPSCPLYIDRAGWGGRYVADLSDDGEVVYRWKAE